MIKKQKIKVLVVIVLTSLLLASCATTVNMSQQSREKIKKVSINPHVVVPKNINYVGNVGGAGVVDMLLLSPFDASTARAAKDYEERERIEKLMVSYDIHISEIVKAQFIQQIKQKKLFVDVTKNSDAFLNIIVKSYGLSTFGFSAKLRPTIYLKANLTNKQHQIIWQQYRLINVLSNNMPRYSLKEIAAHPKYLRYMLNAAAKEAVRDILRTL